VKRDEKLPRAVIIVAKSEPEPSIKKALNKCGITLQWARSIKAASGLLESALNGTVVITELSLRDGNWRDLVERVKAIRRVIPVVLLSSSRTAELWWDALEYGVDDILQAPISTPQLGKYLAEHFKARSNRL
jgi:DNA-binding NtrC family response regulator